MDLLQLWQNIGLEARDLATAVERLPDECECGDADAHLGGRCACCGGHTHGGYAAESQDCVVIISRLRADLAALGQDLSIAGPALGASAVETRRLELRRGHLSRCCRFGGDPRIVQAGNRVRGRVSTGMHDHPNASGEASMHRVA